MALAVAVVALAGCGAAGEGLRVGTGTPSTTSPPPPPVTISSIPVTATTRPTLPPVATPSTAGGGGPTAPTPTTTPASAARSASGSPSPSTTTPPAAGALPPTTAALSGPAPTCRSSQLSADQIPLGAGTGHYFLAWSLTDTSGSACTVPAGRPALQLDDAAGRPVVDYRTGALGGGSAVPVTVAPHQAAWFLTEEISTGCPTSTTVSGGPFTYEITLPGGAGTVGWRPGYLASGTLSGLCTRVGLEVGGIRATEPRA